MKKILFLTLVTLSFISCEENEIIEEQPTKILGEWEMYRNENLESIIDQWTGTEWTYKNKWFRTIRNDSKIILEFKENGTFVNRYADVITANGVWLKITENRYSFECIQDENNINESLTQKRYITFYCDNTYAVKIKGDDKTIHYYQEIGTTACADLIEYKVND